MLAPTELVQMDSVQRRILAPELILAPAEPVQTELVHRRILAPTS